MYLESRDEPCEKNKEKRLYDFLRKWTENGGNYAGKKGKLKERTAKKFPESY